MIANKYVIIIGGSILIFLVVLGLLFSSLDTNQEFLYKEIQKMNELEIKELKSMIIKQDEEIAKIRELIIQRNIEIIQDTDDIKSIQDAINALEADDGK